MDKIEEFWKKEEERDRKFYRELDKEMEKIEETEEDLLCSEKCINNLFGKCIVHDYKCRQKLDMKEMKFR